MKFRYYITDIGSGTVIGTNKTEHANDFALCEDYFVVDSEAGIWLQSEGGSVEVKDCEKTSE